MRIVQITDLHIGQEGEDTYGRDVRANFLRVVGAVPPYAPDLLVLSGDLCFRDGDEGAYRWVAGHLEKLGIPFEIIGGNHDDVPLMARVFGRERELRGQELYFTREMSEGRLLFLDSASGRVSEGQLEWLRKELTHPEPSLLFIHHPVLFADVPHMDNNYALENRTAVAEMLKGAGRPLHLFCGHYHVDKVVAEGLLVQHITPSCFFQIDQFREEFQVDHDRVGFRIIDWEGERLRTTVRYLDGEKL